MPPERAPTAAATTPAPPLPVRVLWLVADAIVVVVAIACILMLLVRFVVFPRVEAHQDDIAAALGKRVGQPVSIAGIGTGWDGWSPRLSVRGFTVHDGTIAGPPTLMLPRVDLVVSWTSLPLLDLRLKELSIHAPRLAVRRDADGRIHVAGMAIDPSAASDNDMVTEWLLRQPRIVVHDGLVTWTDERRQAPQLVLDRVELRLEKGVGLHRLGLTGVPPAELAAPLDLRAEFTPESVRDWRTGRGRAYLRMDYADVGAWRAWLPLPIDVERGQGALRLWFEFADGAPVALTADVELANVRARLGADVEPVDFAHVSGRIGGRQDAGRRELETRALTFSTPEGATLPAAHIRVRVDVAGEPDRGHGDISVDRLELAPLTALASHLPIDDRWRRELARFMPAGAVRDARLTWDGPADAPVRYRASASFAGVSFAAVESIPGASGIGGKLEASEAGGSLVLERGPAVVALPRIFAAPLGFDAASARLSWTRAADGTTIRLDESTFSNADVAGTAAGTWRANATGPGTVDLRGQLTRASVGPLPRYTPRQLSEPLREWLTRALVKGQASDVRVVLKGNLADFPFADGRNGQFLVAIKAQDATLDYAEHWPAIRDVDADIRFEGSRLTIDATSGRVLGATLDRTRVEIADLRVHPATVHVEGAVEGPTAEFLAFVAKSPVGEWINHVADSAQATGDGRLALRFDLPLNGSRASALSGEYQFTANRLRFAGVPSLTQLTGTATFTDREVQARDVTAEVFGGPARVQLTSAEGRMRVQATGTANVGLLRREFDVPMVDRMSGTADWQLAVDSRPESLSWTVESSLKGTTVDLPVPLGKGPDETVPLKVARRETRGGRGDALTFDYGPAARIVLHRQLTGTTATVDGALVLLGRAVERGGDTERKGLWVRADVPTLNVDDWLAFQRSLDAPPAAGSAPPISPVAAPALALEGLDLAAGTLQALGRTFNTLHVTGQRTGNDWRLVLDGREVSGTATWQAATPAQPNGRVVARLTRLVPPAPGELVPWSGAQDAANKPAGNANPWPAIDMTSDAFYKRGTNVGRIEVQAEPAGSDWRIAKLSVVNDAGRIDASGLWRGGRAQQTSLDVKVDVQEAGAFLGHFAMPDAIRRAPTTVEGQLAWAGAPSDFDYPSLSGHFDVRSGAGQFLKADPGVGRLLGVLSLQALPRRISLDFRDVFSEGFAFDSVQGTVRIQNGVMQTDQFKLVGPAAAVEIAGSVDLAHETQQLRVRVQPALSSSVSVGTAALFIANPLLGAAVGAGTLLAQKMLNNPIEKMFSYEYGVSGGWDEPVVQRLTARTAAAWPETTTK
jgi:uncharacterized protein (TIGR02099 family)